jgi:signal transduction histidine kinase
MIASLLDSSQLESGTFELTHTRFDLSELLKEIIDQFTITTQGKNQSLEHRLPSEYVDIEADSDRLIQIVTNLLDNASKYSPAEATIELSMKPNDDSVLIRVKDDGMGIPEEEQDRIFERFERGSHVDVGRQRGLGLGLSLVSLLVSLHGGKIELKSKPGSGTEVTVTLPRRQGS